MRFKLLFFSFFISTLAYGEPDPYFELTFARTGRLFTSSFADLTVAPLDSATGDGVAILNRIGVNYASPTYDPRPPRSFHVDLFLGGSITEGPNDYGLGNVELGARWQAWERQESSKHELIVFGMDLIVPFANTESAPGLSTPNFVNYFEDAWGFRPHLYYAVARDRWRLGLNGGVDLLLLTESPAPLDVAELFANYGGGLAYAFHDRLQFSLEAHAITALTPEEADTQLWSGPGIIFERGWYRLQAYVALSVFEPSRSVLQPLFNLALHYRM